LQFLDCDGAVWRLDQRARKETMEATSAAAPTLSAAMMALAKYIASALDGRNSQHQSRAGPQDEPASSEEASARRLKTRPIQFFLA
jgi:hypothetical protein